MRILSNSLFGRINCVFLWYNKEKLFCRYAEKSMNAFTPGIACGLGISGFSLVQTLISTADLLLRAVSLTPPFLPFFCCFKKSLKVRALVPGPGVCLSMRIKSP